MIDAQRPVRLVLLDLDGTLADTFPDLRWALDTALAEHGRTSAPEALLRARVSLGARAMAEAALGAGSDVLERVLARFLTLYEENVAVRSRLFEGMVGVLDALDAYGVPVGVVTNKRQVFTAPLLERLALTHRLRCVVSGDTAARAKPHPDPLLHAAQLAGLPVEHCAYVGDSVNDVIASRSAGVPVAVACWGYLGQEDPRFWQADALLEQPRDLLPWLGLER